MGALRLTDLLHDLSLTLQEFDLDHDCFSIGQLESKDWVIQIIKDLQGHSPFNLGTVFILCGWYGILPAMIFSSGLLLGKIRSFDIDDSCWKIADRINRTSVSDGWKFKAATEDIFDIKFFAHKYKLWSYAKEKEFEVSDIPDTIINTSCEHTTPDWFKNIPRQKLVILQSNNFWDGKGHINCVDNLDEFKQMFPLKDIFYAGKLHCEKYTRFMLVGMT